jgi:NAD(P)-dependent dehydrogenase (short-subunit alcohol dehydrogenase family)
MKKTIIMVGAGKGLGNAIAKKFGSNDFRVVLLARNENSLKEYEEEFREEGIEVYTHAADAAKPASLTSAFDNVKAKFGTPDVLVYHVGITGMDQPGSITSEELMRHFQVDVASAYHCVQQVVSGEFGTKKGVIIFTGGGLALYPHPLFTPLSIDKAALRALAFLLNAELEPKGIFVGTVTIAGAITPNTNFAPEMIAEKYWHIYNERKEREVMYQ